MNTHGLNEFYKVLYTTEIAVCIGCFKACEVTEILTQRSTEEASFCEDHNDLIRPTSIHTPNIDIAVSVVYDI